MKHIFVKTVFLLLALSLELGTATAQTMQNFATVPAPNSYAWALSPDGSTLYVG